MPDESTQYLEGKRAARNKTSRRWNVVAARETWCGGKDSNLHGIATASPSSWCVCQFRHHRKKPLATAGVLFGRPLEERPPALLLIVLQTAAKSIKLLMFIPLEAPLEANESSACSLRLLV
jgi:hypothetical protein